MLSRHFLCREGGIAIKKIFNFAAAGAALAFFARCAACGAVDPATGYGNEATKLSLICLFGLCVILFIATKIFTSRHPIPISIPPAGHDFGVGGAVIAIVAGVLTLGSALVMLVSLVASGAIPMLFMTREQLIALGLREFSFRWLLASGVLGIPTGIWMLAIAKWNIKGDGEFPGGLWLSLFPGLYYMMRAIALYTGGGSNPNDEVSATCFCLILMLVVMSARFGGYISLDRTKKYAEPLLPASATLIIAAAAALPNLPLMLRDPISAAMLIADSLLALYLFLAARRMFTKARYDHKFSIEEVK